MVHNRQSIRAVSFAVLAVAMVAAAAVAPSADSERAEGSQSPPLARDNADAAAVASPYGVTCWHSTEHAIDEMEALGVEWVRIPVMWRWHEPREGEFYWETDHWGGAGRLDTWLSRLSARGFKVCACLLGPPSWAREQVDGQPGLPYPDKMAAFCAALATRYGPMIDCYEVISEQYVLAAHKRDEQAIRYIPILTACRKAIKSISPDSLIACCGMWAPHGDCTCMTYLGELYRAGGKDLFDVANVHFYIGNNRKQDPRPYLEFQLAYLRWVMAHYGDEGKELWITEYGYAVPNEGQNDGPFTHFEQAFYLSATQDICRRSGVVTRTFWYQLRNDDGMALIHTQFADEEGSDDYRRPAYWTYQWYISEYPMWDKEDVVDRWAPDTANPVPIQNAGFEDDVTGWWGNATWDPTRAHSGAASAKITVSGEETGATQVIDLGPEPSPGYVLTGYLRPNPNVGARMAIGFRTADKKWCGHVNGNTIYDPLGCGAPDQWHEIQIGVQTPPDAAEAVIYVWATEGEGDIWYDDVQLLPFRKQEGMRADGDTQPDGDPEGSGG
jgi:hypothetical protein